MLVVADVELKKLKKSIFIKFVILLPGGIHYINLSNLYLYSIKVFFFHLILYLMI